MSAEREEREEPNREQGDDDNLEARIASEGMAVGMETGEDYTPDGRRSDLRSSVPGTHVPGANEPAAEGEHGGEGESSEPEDKPDTAER